MQTMLEILTIIAIYCTDKCEEYPFIAPSVPYGILVVSAAVLGIFTPAPLAAVLSSTLVSIAFWLIIVIPLNWASLKKIVK